MRIFNVKNLSNTVFKEPTPYPGALRAAVTQGYSPHNHRGEWRGVSPDELARGMILAVADAARSEAGNADLLNAWKRCLLSTPFAFAELATANERTWHALQLRELLSTEYFAARRSCVQRCFEVAKLRHRLAETVSAKAAACMIHKEYQKQLTMCPGSAGAETQVRDLKLRDRPGVVLTQGG